MLFNSFEFLFVYLPITFSVFFLLGRYSQRAAVLWLVAASIGFYGYWNPAHVPILVCSILANFTAGVLMINGTYNRRLVLAVAVTGNLLGLGFFKYLDFAIVTINTLFSTDLVQTRIELPLGISFFTFTQIAFLVDVYRRLASDKDLGRYALFVTYFPHLIAGPILHHRPTMSQFALPQTFRPNAANIALGLFIFGIGIAKKVGIADNIAPIADHVFNAARDGDPLATGTAWLGALAYTFQLYFDFSGYSDMAIGLSLLFNVTIPINFLSPYKAGSIIDFWRRWHISLSTFLRDYLYIALGGNRRGRARRYLNLLITMVLGGLWHGAAWTFVVWGTLHGLFLLINHAWRTLAQERGWRMPPLLGWFITFVAVVVAWVFFRSEGFEAATRMLGAMFGAADLLRFFGAMPPFHPVDVIVPLAAAAIIALFLPNSIELLERLRAVMVAGRFRRACVMALASGFGMGACLMLMNRVSPFLYFQF